MKPFQPFFRGRRHVRGKLRSSAFRRGFDHPSIIIQSRSSVHLARKKKNRVLPRYCGTAYAVPRQGNHRTRPQTQAWPGTRERQRQRRRQNKRRQEQQTPETAAGSYSVRRCCTIACRRLSTRPTSQRLGRGHIGHGRPTTSMDQQQRICLINRYPPRRPETSSHIRPSLLLRRARIQHYPQWRHLPTNA